MPLIRSWSLTQEISAAAVVSGGGDGEGRVYAKVWCVGAAGWRAREEGISGERTMTMALCEGREIDCGLEEDGSARVWNRPGEMAMTMALCEGKERER
ncbi:hypothetical protein ACLOJK_010293 [Asimina triloba]